MRGTTLSGPGASRWCRTAWLAAATTALLAAGAARGQTFFWTAVAGDWSNANNWSDPGFNDYPRFSTDSAVLNGPNFVSFLTEDITIGRLEIRNRANVQNAFGSAHRLRVVGETLLDGPAPVLQIFNAPDAVDFETDTLTISSTLTTGGLILDNNPVVQINTAATTSGVADIRGRGTVRLNTGGGDLVNNGTIIAENGTLRIEGTAGNSGVFDWDGTTGAGVIDIRDDAILDIALSQGNDAFGGTILMRDGAEMFNSVPWTLDTTGVIRVQNFDALFDDGDIRGTGKVTSRGWLDASGGALGFDTELETTGGRITMGSATQRGIFNVSDGIVRPATTVEFVDGNFAVGSNHTFTLDQTGKLFDWDGDDGAANTVLNFGSDLTIIADTINPNTGAFTTNRYSGFIRLDGKLTVNGIFPDLLIAKTLGGSGDATVTMSGAVDPAQASTYDGVPIVFGGDSTFRTTGASTTPRHSRFDAPARFDGGTIELVLGSEVSFNDRVEFRGGSTGYSGVGTMRFNDEVIVNTTLLSLPFGVVFGAGSQTTVVPATTVNLNGPVTLEGGDFFGGAGRTLNVGGPLTVSAPGTVSLDLETVNLNGPVTFAGGAINGLSSGVGATINLNADAVATSGVTTIDVVNFNLDGPFNNNTITVNAGAVLDLNGTDPDPFDGTLNLAGTFDYNNRGPFFFVNDGTINLTGGMLLGDLLRHNGVITSSGDSRLFTSSGGVVFQNGSTTTLLGGTLTVGGGFGNVEDTASFFGAGTLVFDTIMGVGDTNFGLVPVHNDRMFALVGSQVQDFATYRTVTAQVQSYTQSADGEFFVALAGGGGTPGTDFSTLEVAGTAALDGTLNLLLIDGYNPSEGDSFLVLQAPFGLTGQFGDAGLPELDPGLVWEVTYDFNEVLATVVEGLRGDYNDNGVVEQSDLDLVLLNWGSDVRVTGVPAGWVNDLPFGVIDQAELDGVLLNWGNTAEASFTPVPEPFATVLVGVVGLLALLQRHSRSRCSTAPVVV